MTIFQKDLNVTKHKHPFVICNPLSKNTYYELRSILSSKHPKQGHSGLGLDSQKATVKKFCGNEQIIAEYEEIESGTKNNRIALKLAIDKAKTSNSVLIIAKLDRLSRDVNFISGLMKAEVNFIACDQPQANKFTLHIFAALAEQERDMISERTKNALAALKVRGKVLGTPKNLTQSARAKGVATIQKNALHDENNTKAAAYIAALYKQGLSFSMISKELNKAGFKTRNDKNFQTTQIIRIWNRVSFKQIA